MKVILKADIKGVGKKMKLLMHQMDMQEIFYFLKI